MELSSGLTALPTRQANCSLECKAWAIFQMTETKRYLEIQAAVLGEISVVFELAAGNSCLVKSLGLMVHHRERSMAATI
jgi:hypothetical protein